MIERLINILRNAGFEDITATEVAEMILLADFLPVPIQKIAESQVGEPTEPAVEPPPRKDEAGESAAKSQPDPTPVSDGSSPIDIYDETASEAEGEGVDVIPFRTPAPNALPGAQKIARALRPLRRRYPSTRRFVLDEERTVRRIADCGLFSPVLRPAPENWLEAALVFDESVSMRVWRETLDQFEHLFERCGYFRDVRSWRLNTEDVEARLFRESAGRDRLERRPGELLDPARRRLIIVITDCLGPAWQSGAAFRLAHGWAANGPVALVQTLPRCFWAGTSMTPVDAALRSPKPGAPNRLLQIAPLWYEEIAEAGGVGMPILTLDEWSIAPWAQSVAGAGGVVVSGLMIPPPKAMAAEKLFSSDSNGRDSGARSAKQRIAGFFQSASHEAKRLACYLASAPLSLPVMRLVQQTMLPGTRQTHLAEVFLSGLIYQLKTEREQGEILYEFYDGVREELRRRVTEAETERVIYQVSRFIESRIGESGDFEAMLAVPAAGGAARRLDPLSRRFASLSAEIFKRSGRRRELVERLERIVGATRPETSAPVVETNVEPSIEADVERPRVYVSHSMDDREQVDVMYQRLIAQDFAPWIDRYEISSAQVWEEQALRAIRNADFFLLFLSRKTTRRSSVFYQQELRTALDLCAGERRNDRFLIPVRLEECELPAEIADRRAVNLYEQDGFNQLTNLMRAELRRRRQNLDPKTPPSLSPLERCLRDELEEEAAAQLAGRVAGMTAIEAAREMREQGIERRNDALSSVQESSLIFQPASRQGQIVYRLLLEASHRCRVLKSAADLLALIPQHLIGAAAVRHEVERIKDELYSAAVNVDLTERLMRVASGRRVAAIQAAIELHYRYSDGVLLIDLENRAIDHYEVMQECIAPFLKLSIDSATNPLLIMTQFESIFGRGEYLIILDKNGDYREMSNLSLTGGSFILAIDRAIDPLPNRSAVEARLREARENFDRVSAQLQAIQQERDLVKLPAPQLRTNLDIQRRGFLQDIRECESQLRGLERDPVMGLAELIKRLMSGDQRQPASIDAAIAKLRNAPSEEEEAVRLRELAAEFGTLHDYQTASQLCEFAIDREPRDLKLHVLTLVTLAAFRSAAMQQGLAAQWAQKAMENAIAENDSAGLLRAQVTLGEIRNLQRSPEEAVPILLQAIENAKAINDRSLEARARLAFGETLLSQSKPTAARDYFDRASTIYEDIGDQHRRAYSLEALARALDAEGEYRSAVDAATQALGIFTELNSTGAQRVRQILNRLSSRAIDPVPQPQTFTFTTIRLNSHGREIERRTLSARQFIEDLGEGVRLEMVELPGGTFLMGLGEESMEWGVREYSRYARRGEDAEQWFRRHTPRMQVVVPSFLIGKFAVTQRQWEVVANWEPIERRLDPRPSYFQFYPEHPVESICWAEAWEFCARLRRQTGRGYRLPSEAEWEYACRAGTTSPFAFGETITPEIVNYNGSFPCADAPTGVNRDRTVPVGSLEVANAFGLFDMHGNVWEWCDDTWHDDYRGAPTDGRPWISTSDADRGVLRGGAWRTRAFRCSSNFRLSEARGAKAINFGFRVVLDLQTQSGKIFSTDEHR